MRLNLCGTSTFKGERVSYIHQKNSSSQIRFLFLRVLYKDVVAVFKINFYLTRKKLPIRKVVFCCFSFFFPLFAFFLDWTETECC